MKILLGFFLFLSVFFFIKETNYKDNIKEINIKENSRLENKKYLINDINVSKPERNGFIGNKEKISDIDILLDLYINTNSKDILEKINGKISSNSKDSGLIIESALKRYKNSNKNDKIKLDKLFLLINNDENFSIFYEYLDYNDVNLVSSFIYIESLLNTYKSTEILMNSINEVSIDSVEGYINSINMFSDENITGIRIENIEKIVNIKNITLSEAQEYFLTIEIYKLPTNEAMLFMERNSDFFSEKMVLDINNKLSKVDLRVK